MLEIHVPVYLPGQTVVGSAMVLVGKNRPNSVEITIETTPQLLKLIEEDIIGFQAVFLDRGRAEEVLNNQGEKEDG